jgi:hypothetical protein
MVVWRMRSVFAAALLSFVGSFAAQAQIPHIVGTWKLNVAESRLPGPAPHVHVRRYSLTEDGTLIGLAVTVDARGVPNFLQFAAKDDGKDYSEYDSFSLARLQIDGSTSRATYAETPVDSHTVDWVDKLDGRVTASGRKWVSEDGQKLTFTANAKRNGEDVSFLFVFDREPDLEQP